MRLFFLLLFVPSLLLSQKIYNYYDECDWESYRNELNNFTEDSSSILYLKESKKPVNGFVEWYNFKTIGLKQKKQISEKCFFVNGKKEGTHSFYYNNGNIEHKILYIDGKNNSCLGFYKNGNIEHKDSIDHFIEWYRNGKISNEVNKNKEIIFTQKSYYNNGNLKFEKKKLDDINLYHYTFYFKNTEIRSGGDINGELYLNTWYYFYKNGNIKKTGSYDKKGYMSGKWVFYKRNEKIKKEILYED